MTTLFKSYAIRLIRQVTDQKFVLRHLLLACVGAPRNDRIPGLESEGWSSYKRRERQSGVLPLGIPICSATHFLGGACVQVCKVNSQQLLLRSPSATMRLVRRAQHDILPWAESFMWAVLPMRGFRRILGTSYSALRLRFPGVSCFHPYIPRIWALLGPPESRLVNSRVCTAV